MPGGLPEVTQRFDADASGYVAGIQKMIDSNRELIASIGDAKRKLGELGGDARGGNLGMFGPGGAAQIRDYNRAMDEYGAAIKEAAARNAELSAAQAGTEKLSREGAAALRSLSEEYRRHGETVAQAKQAQAIFRDGLIDQANSTRDAVVAMSEHEQAVARLAKTYGTAQEAFAKSDFSTPVQYTTTHVEKLNDALAVMEKRASSFSTAFYGAGGASRAGDALRGVGAGAFGPFDPNFIRGGGGGGGGGALAGAAAGGLASKIFGGALPTLQAAHMITMLTMETLSTVIPAAVAAGAAGVVGLQAGQNLYLRGNAMYSAQEALGGAYGNQTFGTMLGLSRNLQNAQDLAQGGVFGIGGGLRDLVGQGSGAFTGMGVQTIAMVDRGIANMVLHNRMKQVTDAVAGGTGFLRSFGDIGANIGDTLLNLAPNLPGIGPGLLGGLKGITGAAAFTTGHIPGPLLGAGLAAEAGWRWGGPILGGGKLPGWLGGAKFGGLAGLAERWGLGTVADAGAGIEGAGLAGVLGAEAGPIGLVAALGALEFSSLNRIQSPAQRNIAGWQGAINQSFGAGALQPITGALYKASQDAAAAAAAPMAAPTKRQLASKEGVALEYAYKTSPGQLYPQAVQSFAQQLGDLVTAGPSAIKALQGIGIKGTTLTQAFEAMSMAMISPKDLKGGHLDATAKQQLQQFAQTYRTATIGGQPGTASGLLMAGAADYIMSSTQMKSLAQVNQGLDAMTQIMTGGPAGQAALFGMLGGTPTTHTRAGLKVAAPYAPATQQFARALSNVFSPRGAASWTTFAGPQGMIAAQQANLDQMRTYLTLGAITGKQGAQLSAFDLQQMLPLTAHSPMAQAMLEQQAMQANIPGISVGMSYKNLVRAITGTATTGRGAMGILTQGTKAVANLPGIAADLITGGMGGPSALQSALTAQMAQQALALAAHPLARGGGVNMAGLQGLMSSLAAGGTKPGQMQIGVDAILKNLHVPPNMIAKINAQVGKVKIPHVPDQHYNVVGHAHVPHIPHVPNQSFTITGHVVIAGRTMAAAAAGVPSFSLPGGGGMRIHAQTGGLVPGSGSGDIIPSMLEPGEAIVPRNLVPLVAPILAAHNVPGFGTAPKGRSTHFAAGGIVPHMLGFPDPTRMSGDLGKHVGFTLIDGITKALNQAGARQIAQALVAKIAQEVQYAKSVSSQAQQGLNFGGIDPAQGPVTDQMQSYLSSLQSFTKDVGSLRKQHLNKSLMQQLIAAGPVQGDAIAQSILQGGGTSGKSGVGQVNQLWAQIGKASNALGAQAAMSKYGGHLSPDLKSGSNVTNNVSISISAGGGGGLGDLSDKQLNHLVSLIQKKLLQQAQRNRKTGVKLPGKNA